VNRAPVIRVEEIANYTGQEVTVQGWVYNRTDKGKLVFLLVRDGSGFVQCVAFKGDLSETLFDQLTRLPQESSVIISGPVREDKRAPGIPGGYEIGVKDIKIVQLAGENYPIGAQGTRRGFRPATTAIYGSVCPANGHSCVFAPQSSQPFVSGFEQNGFINMDTPILTPASVEGTTTLFETEYFDEGKAYLSQSGPTLQRGEYHGLCQVYCFGPTFRARNPRPAGT